MRGHSTHERSSIHIYANLLFAPDAAAVAALPQAKALLQLMGENPHMARIVADKEASMPAFMEMIRSGKR